MHTYDSLLQAVRDIAGTGRRILSRRAVSGGDIHEACELVLDDGRRFFMKSNAPEAADNFRAEASGLLAIAATGTAEVPEVLGTGVEAGGAGGAFAFLLLPFLERGRRREDYWERLARDLHAMHSAPSVFEGFSQCGFPEDNYIGTRKQSNALQESWIAFFRDSRLEPQLRDASDRGYLQGAQLRQAIRLLEHLDRCLSEPDGAPSLLHGDLWSGNVMQGPDGAAWLIDPAVYYGHPEADLAMTELFGGFAGRFYDVYRETAGRDSLYGYEDRRDLYNLYQLLNHLNMFGTGYLPSVLSILQRYAGK